MHAFAIRIMLALTLCLGLSACANGPSAAEDAPKPEPDVQIQPEPDDKPAAPEQPDPVPEERSPVTIAWGGDVTPGSRYGLPPDHGEQMLSGVGPALMGADLAWVNLEGTLSTGGVDKCGEGYDYCYSFQANPRYTKVFTAQGVDGVNLANNHALDFGWAGYDQTLRALDEAGLAATGAPDQVTVQQVRGVRVAFVGLASYPWSGPLNDHAAAAALVREASSQADIVVVLFHGGAEGSDKMHVPNGTEYAFRENRGSLRAMSRAVIDAGADLVLGSGPHVVRGMETYKGRLIAYSLGNLAGEGNFSSEGNLAFSGVLQVRVDLDGRTLDGQLHSALLDNKPYPSLDPSGQTAKLVARLSREDFGRSAVRLDRAGRFVVARPAR